MASNGIRRSIGRKYGAVVISTFLNRMSILASVYISKTSSADQAPLDARESSNPPTAAFWVKAEGRPKKREKKKKKTYTAIHALDSEQLKNETKYGSRGVVPRRPAFSSARELNVYRDRLGRLYFEVLVRADVRIS